MKVGLLVIRVCFWFCMDLLLLVRVWTLDGAMWGLEWSWVEFDVLSAKAGFLFDIFDWTLHFGFIARICKTGTTAVPSFTDLSEKLGFLILNVCCFNLEVRSLQLNHGLWVTFYNDWPAIDQFYMFFQFLKFLAIVWVQLSVLLGFKELT